MLNRKSKGQETYFWDLCKQTDLRVDVVCAVCVLYIRYIKVLEKAGVAGWWGAGRGRGGWGDARH